MAPELFDNSARKEHFDAYKQGDIYAFGLVLWEIARRCISNGMIVSLPFYVLLKNFSLICRRTIAGEGLKIEVYQGSK
jgi:activin receptor type-1